MCSEYISYLASAVLWEHVAVVLGYVILALTLVAF